MKVEGRNAVTEAPGAGVTIDKLLALKGLQYHGARKGL